MLAFQSLWAVLDARARRDFALLALFSTVAGFLETTAVSLIIPFMAAATNTGPFGPSGTWTREIKGFLTQIGVEPSYYTPALGLVFLVGTVVANLVVVGYQYFSLLTVFRERASLSTRLLTSLSLKSLGWYESQNSSELSKTVMADVERVSASLNSLAQLLGILIRCGILALFFLFAQLRLAIALACSLAFSFFVVFRFIHRPLVAAGEQSVQALERMYGSANDVFDGVREIKASGTSDYFLKRFELAADSAVHPEVVRGMPPHLTRTGLETLILTTIIVILVYFHSRDKGLANGLPLMSAYAIAGIRLLPSLQQALFHWVQIRFLSPSVFRVEELLQPEHSHQPGPERSLTFEHSIEVKNLSFAYVEGSPTLDDISFSIQKNERVAFVGATGSGKSTLMDLLLGLRQATTGSILVDGIPLDERTRRSWLGQVGYVPQNVFLLDASIQENVAFGVTQEKRERSRVEAACRASSIHNFIVSDLPQAYETSVGERGARLSGGQCQRLSIARALYHDPPVVFFDEATSSLDNVTEDEILNALNGLRGTKTLIVVAHRLNTVWDFDRLIVLERGRVVGSGKAEELMNSCPSFRNLVRQSPESGSLVEMRK